MLLNLVHAVPHLNTSTGLHYLGRPLKQSQSMLVRLVSPLTVWCSWCAAVVSLMCYENVLNTYFV